MMVKISKSDFDILQELFIYETPDYNSPYPPQLKNKIAERFIENNWIEEIEIKEGAFSMKCHKLSHLGMYIYCSNCKGEE